LHRKGWRARYKAVNEQAYGYYTKATEAQPSSAEAWFQLGYFQLLTRNCARAAYTAFNRATTLDPKNPLYNEYYASTLARVNSGKPRC
jgi:cytochrome c-type biogenesis protein CcmH/NrfG